MAEADGERSRRFFSGPMIAIGLLVFLATAAAGAPASLLGGVLAQNGVRYVKTSGTLWRGRFEDVSYGDTYLGDVAYQLKPLALLTGGLGADLHVRGGPLTFTGGLSYSLLSRAVGVSDASADYALASLSDYSIFGLPYDGSLKADIARLNWSSGGCAKAEAQISTDILHNAVKQFIGEGMDLKGAAFCDRKALAVEFTGQNSQASTVIDIVVAPDLTFRLNAQVRPERRQIETGLVNLGFQKNGDTLVYTAIGELRGLGS